MYVQKDATLHNLFYLETTLHVSGGTSTHHQERKQLYLQHLVLFVVFVTPLLLPAAIAVALQINHQPDAIISPVYYLTFIYSSTCFRRPHAHPQELNNCSSSLWFYRWSVVVAVLWISPRSNGKTKGCYCS
jgi:hypothetical protein